MATTQTECELEPYLWFEFNEVAKTRFQVPHMCSFLNFEIMPGMTSNEAEFLSFFMGLAFVRSAWFLSI